MDEHSICVLCGRELRFHNEMEHKPVLMPEAMMTMPMTAKRDRMITDATREAFRQVREAIVHKQSCAMLRMGRECDCGYHNAIATLARLEAEYKQDREDMDLLFGEGWQESLKAVQGKPHDAVQMQLTYTLGSLAIAQDEIEKLKAEHAEREAECAAMREALSVFATRYENRVFATRYEIHPDDGDYKNAYEALKSDAGRNLLAERDRLAARCKAMEEALRWILEPDHPIGSDAEFVRKIESRAADVLREGVNV